jgi:hypothetical protein
MLPKALKTYIKDLKARGGEMEMSFENVISASITDKKMTECIYEENGTKLQWFKMENITYIMIDDVQECFIEEGKLVYI